MSSCTAVNVESLHRADSMQRACFGPNGLQGIAEHSDGGVVLVRGGVEAAIGFQEEPLMKFVGQSLRCLLRSTGDGSKRMMIILASLLRECERTVPEKTTSTELSHVFYLLTTELLHTIIPNVLNKEKKVCSCLGLKDSPHSLRLHLDKILNTSLSSHCTYSARKVLKEMLLQFLLPQAQTDQVHTTDLPDTTDLSDLPDIINSLRTVTSHYESFFDVHVMCVEGAATSLSRAIPGFLIDRELCNPSLLNSLSQTQRFKVLLLHSELILDVDDATLRVSSEAHLKRTMESLHMSSGQRQAVEWMALNNVRLLLSSTKLSNSVVHFLSGHHIAAVQMVDSNSLLAIAEYCGTQVSSHTDHLSTQLSDNLMPYCISHGYISIGRKRLLHLQFQRGQDPRHNALKHIHSLVVCAPTVSYGRQLVDLISSSLKMVLCWSKQVVLCGEPKLVTVCGGGAWEIALSQELEDYVKSNAIVKDTERWTAISALRKGLLEIPLTLSLNASFQRTTKLLRDIGHTHSLMISATDGSVIEVGEIDTWPAADPLNVQPPRQEVLLSALSVVSQLLKVDDVIAINKGAVLKNLSPTDSDKDSNSE